ncbi:SDR family oxidoreductase [Sediminibacillus albus]|uniref:3-oxoacyl-[acyl-carrier protein] reductase n=1 Tax=Sediminibacillus albus TaxID=407036 RepID=A0A1G8YJL5_9BACI|nr:SDR family oxidoreductase [Sediminibacillus albus]SDK02837.1 3-oxoacyl-[acyl-carrier protein] reductase [Sediminibacillus albus]
MDLHLSGKTVAVTASSKGIGKASAMEFAREGANVLISSRDHSTLKAVVAEIKQQTGNPHVDFVVCNMKEPADIRNMADKAAAWTGSIDVLVNNAGGPPAGSFLDFSDEDWQHAFELNLLSFIRSIREVVPYMKKQQSGRIVNIASSSIKQTLDNLVLSNTMRPGIAGLAKSLSQELASDNILINTIGPGRIETGRVTELNQKKADKSGIPLDQVKAEAVQAIPFGRSGTPEEFAKAVVFLGSGANTYITGQSLLVDGGLVKAL